MTSVLIDPVIVTVSLDPANKSEWKRKVPGLIAHTLSHSVERKTNKENDTPPPALSFATASTPKGPKEPKSKSNGADKEKIKAPGKQGSTKGKT
jgi:hypothetical protein